MKTVRFYLVRHGQTYSNLRKMMIGGGGSAPLTPKGRQAAKHLGLGLLDTPFVAAYASPLARAVETARLALGGRDMPVTHVEGLRDVFWGDMEGGIPADIVAMKKERPDDPHFPLGDLDTPEYRSPFNGETICAFVDRFEEALTAIALRHQETGGNILAVSHAGLGSFLAVKGGSELNARMDTVNISRMPEVDNTSVSIVEWHDGVFTVKSVNDLSPIRAGEALAAAKSPLEITLFSDVETLFARKRLLEGCCDSMLTDEGRKRARHMRDDYAATPFTHAFHSDLGRAETFASILLEGRDIPVTRLHDLRELSLTYWEAAKREAIRAENPEAINALEQGGDALLAYRPRGGDGPEGGEGGREAAARLEACVRGIAERFEFSGGHIAVFTHPLALSALYASLTAGESRLFRDGTPLTLIYRDDRFTIKK